MSDGTQPGVKIDDKIWQQFREEVERRRGGVRGHLKTEVENAFLDYIHGGDTTPNEINERLQRIEAAIGAAPTDGGVDTLGADSHTHAPPSSPPSERPSPNAATEKKVRWLAACVEDEVVPDFEQVPRDTLRDVVKAEYGFRADTAKRYVAELVDHFDLVAHPHADAILVTEEKREEMIAADAEETL